MSTRELIHNLVDNVRELSPSETIANKRFQGFLKWQFVQSSMIFIVLKILLPPLLTGHMYTPSLPCFFTFISFHFSLLLFSFFLFLVSSPQPVRISTSELRRVFWSRVVVSSNPPTPDSVRRYEDYLMRFMFVMSCNFSGFFGFGSLSWMKNSKLTHAVMYGWSGGGFGLLYGFLFLLQNRWRLEFPIIQRSLLFSFKLGFPSAIKRSLSLSCVACLFSAGLPDYYIFFDMSELPDYHPRSEYTIGIFVTDQIRCYIKCFAVFICWELNHHLYQVLHTKRFIFAPPEGSATEKTNSSELLLAALEESTPRSLLQYLAYLDLSMVCESSVDIWRRAAFFEDTGEIYKRVMGLCLRPLERLALELGEGLGRYSADNTYELSQQLQLPTDLHSDSKFSQLFDNFQLCAWCAQAAASLTVCSRREDKFKVAQLSGSNAYVISTLLSCLLAVETFMGKKTNFQNSNHLMGQAGIKWATINTGRREVTTEMVNKRRGGHSKDYAMVDILRTSIYHITTAFHEEMLSSAKLGLLENDWIINSNPPYGTHELLLQILSLFLDFRANELRDFLGFGPIY